MDESTTTRRELDELAAGLARSGWIVALQPEPGAGPPTHHVVVATGAGAAGARYRVRRAGPLGYRVTVERGGGLRPLGLARDARDVGRLICGDAHRPRLGSPPGPCPSDLADPGQRRWPWSA